MWEFLAGGLRSLLLKPSKPAGQVKWEGTESEESTKLICVGIRLPAPVHYGEPRELPCGLSSLVQKHSLRAAL